MWLSALRQRSRAVWRVLLGTHAHRMLIGACDPMLCPIPTSLDLGLILFFWGGFTSSGDDFLAFRAEQKKVGRFKETKLNQPNSQPRHAEPTISSQKKKSKKNADECASHSLTSFVEVYSHSPRSYFRCSTNLPTTLSPTTRRPTRRPTHLPIRPQIHLPTRPPTR